MVIAQNSDL